MADCISNNGMFALVQLVLSPSVEDLRWTGVYSADRARICHIWHHHVAFEFGEIALRNL